MHSPLLVERHVEYADASRPQGSGQPSVQR